MVTVTQRPQGIKVIDQSVAAVVTNSAGAALVTLTNHALNTGDYIYIESDIDEYNGIWYVFKSDNDNFRLGTDASSGYKEYYQNADIDYYQTQLHSWSSAFLPIVYKATNNRWPTNSVDSDHDIISLNDDNGYTQLITFTNPGLTALEYIQLADGTVWQVVEAAGTLITISQPYDPINQYTTLKKYYNSYQVKVNIYAGLEAGEYWEAKKPMSVVATLSLTPDADNNVMFSVAEYIKALLNIRNNPILYSMPLNLDAFTAFYIETSEAYDASDGYSLYTSESGYAVDSFMGYAVAGKLPFKNRYSGFMSDYVTTSGQPALWLNTLTTVIGVVDNYFDIAFIKNLPGPFQIIIDKYANDYLYATETIDYADFGIGVYRIPLTFSSEYDQFCVRAFRAGTPAIPPETPPTLPTLDDWENDASVGWALGATPTTSVNGNGGVSGWIRAPFASLPGEDHEFTSEINIQVTGVSTPTSEVTIALLNAAGAILDSAVYNYTTAGAKPESFTLNSPTASTYVGVSVTNNTPFDTKNYDINDFVFVGLTDGGEGTPAIPDQDLTQELCIDIYEFCDVDGASVIQPTAARRLLEDGGYRLLEE